VRKAVRWAGWIVGGYLVIRAIVEPFDIDVTDPETYRHDWGGPSLAGALIVHSGPGVVVAVLMITAAVRRARSRSSSPNQTTIDVSKGQ
jgi:hypothetical protein